MVISPPSQLDLPEKLLWALIALMPRVSRDPDIVYQVSGSCRNHSWTNNSPQYSLPELPTTHLYILIFPTMHQPTQLQLIHFILL